jgi:hypothetical protein
MKLASEGVVLSWHTAATQIAHARGVCIDHMDFDAKTLE